MKIWTDRKGNVHSRGRGSIGKQNTETMRIINYLQNRADYMGKLSVNILGGEKKAEQEPDGFGMTD